MGKNIINVGFKAFYGCGNLKIVTLRCSTINFNTYVFESDSNFTEIKLETNEDKYKVEDNIVYSKDGKTLIMCPNGRKEEFNIPDTVEIIKSGAFRSGELSSVIISDTVTSIENEAFAYNRFLENIEIGENVTSIANSFPTCGNLRVVTIRSSTVANNINSKTSMGNLIYYANTIYIKDNINSIGNYITDNYQVTESDKEGYVKYIKK